MSQSHPRRHLHDGSVLQTVYWWRDYVTDPGSASPSLALDRAALRAHLNGRTLLLVFDGW